MPSWTAASLSNLHTMQLFEEQDIPIAVKELMFAKSAPLATAMPQFRRNFGPKYQQELLRRRMRLGGVCVCLCVSQCIYVCVQVYICICEYLCVLVRRCICVCLHSCIQVNIYTYSMCVCVSVRKCMRVLERVGKDLQYD